MDYIRAIPSYISEVQENILTLDIFSNYPNLIHLYNYGSRRAPKMEQMIKEILQQRAQAKKDKDTNKAAYLKELLVTLLVLWNTDTTIYEMQNRGWVFV
ncbi:hypothetical protein NW739_00105 [Mycoplasmopsis felis]|uniref:hypothetical protein n=1 Tax=Mycoplasmopsis felis TaxID=33923 RepID=UPI0021E023B3|nr:hypothetical protein [Mycoplasmopsis felis]MCU9939251.1 hypothetical protein [Mycoplasmopsis felis]